MSVIERLKMVNRLINIHDLGESNNIPKGFLRLHKEFITELKEDLEEEIDGIEYDGGVDRSLFGYNDVYSKTYLEMELDMFENHSELSAYGKGIVEKLRAFDAQYGQRP